MLSEIRNGEIVRAPDGTISTICSISEGRFKGSWVVSALGKQISEDLLQVVTVGELFEAAGHPVPEGANLVIDSGIWFASIDDEQRREKRTSCYRFKDQWHEEPGYAAVHGIDIYRLPALDAWSALPFIIRSVVK